MQAASTDDFTSWLSPHWHAMKQLTGRMVTWPHSEEVLQESVLAAWKHRDRYDPARGSARNWLLAIVTDQCRRHLRRSHLTVVHRDVTALPTPGSQPPDVDLERALVLLTVRQRLAVSLYYYLDLPISDVATAMGCQQGTVKATLAAARDRLRTILGDHHDEPRK